MQVLGAFGSKTSNSNLTSFLIDEDIVIDAGNLINGLDKQFVDLKHLLITHAHYDHIADLPITIDTHYSNMKHSLNVYATKEVLHTIKTNIFNNEIWPDFSQIPLINSTDKAINFVEIELDKSYKIGKATFRAFKNNHANGSCGYVINDEILLTSDTYICDKIWEIVNETPTITKIITEISFPSFLNGLAEVSKHYTPSILKEEMKKLNRYNIDIYVNHLKYEYIDQIKEELKEFDHEVIVLSDNFYIELDTMKEAKKIIKPLNEAIMNRILQEQVDNMEILIKKQSEELRELKEKCKS
jgi:cAMP phosphodiesterase